MFNRKHVAAAAALLLSASAHAAVTGYTNESAFLTATGPLAFESFERVTMPSSTLVDFGAGTFGCSGSAYCPGFFGVSTQYADTGVQSVFFASPDSAKFTFNSPITAFGLHIGGSGDVAPITMTLQLSNGDSIVALNNYSGPYSVFGTNNQYFGTISSSTFVSVTVQASNAGDGIFFDSMSYGVAAVPEPETYAMLLGGLGLLAVARRRRA